MICARPRKFRKYGLKLTVHFAEVDNPEESRYIIQTLRPERIGHGTCVDEELEEVMLKNPIPLGMGHARECLS